MYVMRLKITGFVLALFVLLGCQTARLVPPTPTPSPQPPTATISPTPTPSYTQAPPAPIPTFAPALFNVRTHPDGGLYVGDYVSIEVIAPPDFGRGPRFSVQVSDENGEALGEATFTPFGIGGRWQATFPWVWDTAQLEAGAHEIGFTILPSETTWSETITLQPQDKLPPPEPDSLWAIGESDCCLVYYLTGTAAGRDIEALLASADAQADDAVEKMGLEFTEPIEITLMSRVLGHGGFAGGEIYISYLDRNYAGSDFDLVLHHEMVHILDSRIGGELRPSILVEGLAVYLTGGHFKPEPLMPRAAALLDLEDPATGESWYLPLEPLTENFYKSQHEIGYLQAGALIEFMVDTWGWEKFSNFYRNILPVEGGSHAGALDAALQTHFSSGLAELESQFINALRELELIPKLREDVRLTVTYYDTVRRYQERFDPSAYFLTAWLPDGPEMRNFGIEADLLRHPESVENIALESLLVVADEDLQAGHFSDAEEAIEAVDIVLDAVERDDPFPFFAHPLAEKYYEAVRSLTELEYRVQRIRVDDNLIQAEVTALGAHLMTLQMEWVDGEAKLEQSQ